MNLPFRAPEGFRVPLKDRLRPSFAVIVARAKMPLDLVWFIGWRDLLMLTGAACVTRGVAIWSVPAAWILGGAALLGLAWMMAKGKA